MAATAQLLGYLVRGGLVGQHHEVVMVAEMVEVNERLLIGQGGGHVAQGFGRKVARGGSG